MKTPVKYAGKTDGSNCRFRHLIPEIVEAVHMMRTAFNVDMRQTRKSALT